MKPEDKKAIADALEKHITKTREQIEELKDLTQPIAPENAIGRVSRMDAINNRSVNEAALRKAEQKLVKLKPNLDKLDKPEFGLCTNCGNDIRPERLIYMPESNLCTPCARRRFMTGPISPERASATICRTSSRSASVEPGAQAAISSEETGAPSSSLPGLGLG